MNCACTLKVNTQLGEKAIMLDLAWTIEPFDYIPQVLTKWVSPAGKKGKPPPVLASFCPFCGVAVKAKVPA